MQEHQSQDTTPGWWIFLPNQLSVTATIKIPLVKTRNGEDQSELQVLNQIFHINTSAGLPTLVYGDKKLKFAVRGEEIRDP